MGKIYCSQGNKFPRPEREKFKFSLKIVVCWEFSILQGFQCCGESHFIKKAREDLK